MNEMFSQGGKGSTGILTNKQAIARKFGVKQSEVLIFSVGVELAGFRVLFDKSTQRAYSLPAGIVTGTTAISLSTQAVLVHTAGTVDLGLLAQQRGEYVTVPGTFDSGATLHVRNEVLTHGNTQYRWAGTYPKFVPAGSSPSSAGGIGDSAWIEISGEAIRKALDSISGASMIRTADGETVQEWMIANDSASYRARNIQKLAWVDKQVHSRGSFKALFQGDSMTAGFDTTSTDTIGATDGDWARRATMTYPIRFCDFLREQSGCTVTRVMRAISGHTAMGAYNQPEWQSNPNCDIVFLMYALNDTGSVTESVYMEYMEKLIRRFIDWGMGVVVQTPSSTQTNQIANQWARRMAMMAHTYGCPVFDAAEVMYNRQPGAITSDGGHFNSMGYAIHGRMLASMVMAGGLLPTYRPVTNEIDMWCGRMNSSVGYCDTYGNVNLGLSNGAKTRSKVVGQIPANQAGIINFSFYLDAEAAHIYGHILGDGPLYCITDDTGWWNNGAQPYYEQALSQPVSYSGGVNGAAFVNNLLDTSSSSGLRKFLGRTIGRGWHSITLFTHLHGTGGELYINTLTIQPVPVGKAVQVRGWDDWEKGVKASYIRKFPFPYNNGGNGGGVAIPEPVALTAFQTPFPQSLLHVTPSTSGDFTNSWYNTGHATLKISNHTGSYMEVLLVKTAAGNYVFEGKIVNSNIIDGSKPTAIKATAKYQPRMTRYAANSSGTKMPLFDIQDSDRRDGSLMDWGQTSGDIPVLWVEITWPDSPPTAYWTVELENFDLYGSSDVSV